ncbi:hypothetical protein GGP41_008893 [Bipolaris sorokiniana]|uniref:Uncharacterized protein n=1 Tax=Cochliobolus sativus TaxID=45130 RepID=A0A8H5ZBI8_COCSA|nr:hypothetical protein GGP41_008893 [Bipolaris sorokiniana]
MAELTDAPESSTQLYHPLQDAASSGSDVNEHLNWGIRLFYSYQAIKILRFNATPLSLTVDLCLLLGISNVHYGVSVTRHQLDSCGSTCFISIKRVRRIKAFKPRVCGRSLPFVRRL